MSEPLSAHLVSEKPLVCPACGELMEPSPAVFEVAGGRGKADWGRCRKCATFFLISPFSLAEETQHTKRQAWGRRETGLKLNLFKRKMYLAALSLIRQHAPPPRFLLDVGCSYGGFLLEAQKAGYRVIGLDIVPDAIEYLHSLSIPGEVGASVGELHAVADGSVDIITCLDCNCYWPDQPGELRQIFKKLKASGYLCLRVVDKSWMCRIGIKLRRFSSSLGNKIISKSLGDHRFSMPVQSLLKVLHGSGFQIIYASPRGAVHSTQTALPVKLSFHLGALAWMAGGVFLAPGALILAQKAEAAG